VNREDNQVLHNLCRRPPSALSKSLNSNVIELMRGKGAGVCDNHGQTARKLLILNAE
jgi:hypothetical protein